MSFTIDLAEERILLKYIDSDAKIYKNMITCSDIFVANFCGGRLDRFLPLLKEYKIEKKGEDYEFVVEEPFCIKYLLKRPYSGQNILETKIEILNKNIEEIDEQLKLGVYLPGYSKMLIKINEKKLVLEGPNDFVGSSIESVSFLRDLEIFKFCNNNLVRDFSCLANCKKIKELEFVNSNIESLRFLRNLKELKKIRIEECFEIKDLNILENLEGVEILIEKKN